MNVIDNRLNFNKNLNKEYRVLPEKEFNMNVIDNRLNFNKNLNKKYRVLPEKEFNNKE